MPDEALVTAIGETLDTYSQKQRGATTLMAALKGVTSALGGGASV